MPPFVVRLSGLLLRWKAIGQGVLHLVLVREGAHDHLWGLTQICDNTNNFKDVIVFSIVAFKSIHIDFIVGMCILVKLYHSRGDCLCYISSFHCHDSREECSSCVEKSRDGDGEELRKEGKVPLKEVAIA